MKQTTKIEAAIQNRERIERVIVASRKRLEESGARIPPLAAVVDLDDSAAMVELGRLQLETSILPARISVNEEALLKAEAGLLAACEEFVRGVLNPKAREQEARARAKTKAVLRDHIPQGAELDRAVAMSALVMEAGANALSLEGNPFDGATGYASRVLAAWQAVEALEAKLK